MRRVNIRRTTIIMVGLVSCLIGLAIGKDLTFPGYAFVALVLLIVSILLRRKTMVLPAVIVIGLVVGWWRGSTYAALLRPYKDLALQKVTLRAVVDTDGAYGDKSQLEFDVRSAEVTVPYIVTLPGKLKVSGFGIRAAYKGDVVEVTGKLYPTRGSRQASIGFAEIEVLSRNDTVVDRFRRNFSAGMQAALPEPQASFALGLLFGQRTTLPEDVKNQLSIVGLTHIIAVSGYNLTIIIDAVRRFTTKRSKYQSAVISISLILVFLLITGYSASIVRAAIVSMLSLAAWYYGRTFRPVLLVLLAAVITALWYPVYLWSDIGWHLSFLAFFGVIVVAPLITSRLYRRGKEPRMLMGVLIESLCAQIMTAPLILYIFQQTSPISLISNALIVPLVPLGMLLALVSGVLGTITPVIAGLFSIPAKILLTYMLDIVAVMARVPYASVQRSLSLVGMVIFYCVILVVCVVLDRAVKKKRVIITDTEAGISGSTQHVGTQ